MKIEVVNNRLKLDNEAIKAIRFCRGCNTDLRVKLAVNKVSLWKWLDDNYLGIVGLNIGFDLKGSCARPNVLDDNWQLYENVLNDMVNQICGTY